jgi:outer membrane protein assembly factor BamB
MGHRRPVETTDEAGASREYRYYKRVRRLGATICWGVIALSANELTGAAQQRRPPAARPISAKQPAVQPYQLATSTDLDISGPVSVVVGRTHLVVFSGRGPIQGLALADSSRTWTYDAEITPSSTAPPVADAGLVFVTSAGWVLAIDEATGTVRWRVLSDGRIGPIARSGWVIVPSGEALRAYRADGSLVWNRELGSAVVAQLALDGDRIFAVLADRLLASLDLRTGNLKWVTPLTVDAGDLLAANGRLYFGASDGNFYCYDQTADPDPKWTFPARVGTIGHPVTDGSVVFFAGFDNTIRALDARSGNMKWSSPLVSRPSGDLFVEAGHIVVPLASGDLELRLIEGGNPAGRLTPARGAVNEGIRLESVASGDEQQLFRVTASVGGRRLDVYRRGALALSAVSTPPGRAVDLRAPGQPPPAPR